MRLEDIKDNSIILADSYLHSNIRMQLLEHKESISNVSILSLTVYLDSLCFKRSEGLYYRYYQALSKLELVYFKKVALTGDFIDEVLFFIKNMKRYDIDVTTLPQEDTYQRELKKIVETLCQIPLTIDFHKQALKNKTDFSNVYIIDYMSDLYKEDLYKEMMTKGAQKIGKKELTPQNEFYYTLNKREEVEAMARYIIDYNIPVEKTKLTLLNSEYEGFVEQVFARYRIPYYVVTSTTKSRLIFKYNALIQYYQNPSVESLVKVIEEEVFYHANMSEFLQYIKIFEKNIQDDFNHVELADVSFDVVSKMDYKRLCALETRARKVRDEISDELLHLLTLNKVDALFYIDEIIRERHLFKSIDDVKGVRQIRSAIKEAIPYLDEVPLELLQHVIMSIQIAKKATASGVAITSLQQPLGNYMYHFILGASSDNYPVFKSLDGLFSESYVRLFAYPTIERRFALYEYNLNQNLVSSNKLIVFYATSNFAGKEKEASLEIETFMAQKPKQYRLPFTTKVYEINTQLQKKYGKQLFYPEGIFRGSISAYEMYSNCPFKYFIRHGLKVPEVENYEFESRRAGTLMHYILEVFVQKYGKVYANQSIDEVRVLLKQKIKEILRLYPNLKQEMLVVEKRVLFAIEKNMQILKMMETDSILVPTKTEERFDYMIPLQEEELHLHGYIDRLNENNDFLSIIDYKSSVKKLKEEEVFSALKLQLLTYLVVAARTLHKRPIGAYYYSLGNQVQMASYAKYVKRTNEIEVYDEEAYAHEFVKSKKLEGWTSSEDIKVIDKNHLFINGVGYKKDGGYTTRTNIYNIDGLEKLMVQIYQMLSDNIKLGKMGILPNTCDFCSYGSICHYKGDKFKRELLEVEADIYLVHKGKGGNSNGTVE